MIPSVPFRFDDRRVLITSADVYMGPAIASRFRAAGATVIEDAGSYADDDAEPQRVIAAAGRVDVLILNLLAPPVVRPALDITDDDWLAMFDHMVHPTMRFVRAVLPQMVQRQAGKIVAITSASPHRAIPGRAAYTAARGAQNAFIRVAGAEAAHHNVQINGIAQNYVYGGYPADALDNPRIREELARDVPAGRLAEEWEAADLALFLASDSSNFIAGEVIPFSGGWITAR